eukprot:354762-Chlamydomonas_euryale.AAC.6
MTRIARFVSVVLIVIFAWVLWARVVRADGPGRRHPESSVDEHGGFQRYDAMFTRADSELPRIRRRGLDSPRNARRPVLRGKRQ